MKKTSILKRATSIACAAAMVLTLTPFVADTFGSDEGYAYAANDPAPEVGANLCMTVPLFVTFGGDTGYDVSNPASSITADFNLVNSGKMNAYVSQIVSKDLGATKLFYKMDGAASKTALSAEDPLYSLYEKDNSSKRIDFGPGDETDSGTTFSKGSGVLIGADENSSATCTFRLNLTNTDEVENACFAINTDNLVDLETTPTGDQRNYDTVNKLTQLKITIQGTKFSVDFVANEDDWVEGSYTGKTEAQLQSEKVAFYLIDNELNEIYSIDDVVKQCKQITRSGENTFYTELYREFALDPNKYTCKMRFGTETNYEPIVVIDAYVNRYANPQYIGVEQYKDPVVFQFRNTIGNTTAELTNSSPYSGGVYKLTGRTYQGGAWYGIYNPNTKTPNTILEHLASLASYIPTEVSSHMTAHTNTGLVHDTGTFMREGLITYNSVAVMDSLPDGGGLNTKLFLSYPAMGFRYYSVSAQERLAAKGGFGSANVGASEEYHTGSYGTAGNQLVITTTGTKNMYGRWNTERAVRPYFVIV